MNEQSSGRMGKRKRMSTSTNSGKMTKFNDESNPPESVSLDTKEPCFICGHKVPLRRLINHQMTEHSALQYGPPVQKAITCPICNYAMPSTSLERHIKRKHPKKYEKFQRKKIAEMLKLTESKQSAVSVVKQSQQVPKGEQMQKNEQAPKNGQVRKNEQTSNNGQVPTFPEEVVKKEPKPKHAAKPISSQIPTIKTHSMLSVEADEDGFFDLVITEFSQ